MLQVFVIAIVLFALVSVVMAVVAFIVSVLMLAAVALAVGIPLYLVAKHYFGRSPTFPTRQNAMERLKMLYIEGKIDLFEFERRVAHLIAVEN
jgi:hypothetical protein